MRTAWSRLRTGKAKVLVIGSLGCWTALLALWCIGLGMFETFAALIAMYAAFAFGWNFGGRRLTSAGLSLLVIVGWMLWPPADLVHDFNTGTKRLAAAVAAGGPQALHGHQKVSIYALNLAMGLGGYLMGYREAAVETLLMARSGPKVRRRENSFATASPKIRRHMQDLEARLAAGEQHPSVRVGWRGYGEYGEPKRVSLALNATTLAAKLGPDQRVHWSVTTPIRYPERATAGVARVLGVTVVIQESLFWALQELDWMHTYDMQWHWQNR